MEHDRTKYGGWKHRTAYYLYRGKYYCPDCDLILTPEEANGVSKEAIKTQKYVTE